MRLWLLTVVIGTSIVIGASSGETGALGSAAKSVACYTDCTTGNLSAFLHPSMIMPGKRPVITEDQKQWLETCLKCRNNVDNFLVNLKAFLEEKKDLPKINLICQTAKKLANDPKDYPNAEEINQYFCGGRAKL